jgi:hypothetical protein
VFVFNNPSAVFVLQHAIFGARRHASVAGARRTRTRTGVAWGLFGLSLCHHPWRVVTLSTRGMIGCDDRSYQRARKHDERPKSPVSFSECRSHRQFSCRPFARMSMRKGNLRTRYRLLLLDTIESIRFRFVLLRPFGGSITARQPFSAPTLVMSKTQHALAQSVVLTVGNEYSPVEEATL